MNLGGVRLNQGKPGEDVGGTFGRLILFNTRTYQELLDCQRGINGLDQLNVPAVDSGLPEGGGGLNMVRLHCPH